ncbi:hypothetical protein IV203_017338 [Nitzschia inconspicua]|uniref:Uncharacterized protein n=1 Tax=Nitzschia inconspicua TaxID=303405 RepID=A0A9K3KTA6_9STRA|nr:hypothetical protein IV203_017338 [Nitzschia inconspicua]
MQPFLYAFIAFVILHLSDASDSVSKHKQESYRFLREGTTSAEEDHCPEASQEACDSKGKKIWVCHHDDENEPKSLCVSKQGVQNGLIKSHPKNYCGQCLPEPCSEEACCDPSDCGDPCSFLCRDGDCVPKGDLRFTLSWTGDDDYDLRVVTPAGITIFWRNPYDSGSGGLLDRDRVGGVVGHWEENINFPISQAPTGDYKFLTDLHTQLSAVDNWELSVWIGDEKQDSKTGFGSSNEFTYVHSCS